MSDFSLLIFPISFLLAFIFLGFWTYNDAKANGFEPILWTLIVIFTPYLLGLLIYFIMLKTNPKVTCSTCQCKTLKKARFCTFCGHELIALDFKDKKSKNKFLIISFILFLASVSSALFSDYYLFLKETPIITTNYSEEISTENSNMSSSKNKDSYTIKGNINYFEESLDLKNAKKIKINCKNPFGSLLLNFSDGENFYELKLDPSNSLNLDLKTLNLNLEKLNLTVIAENCENLDLNLKWNF